MIWLLIKDGGSIETTGAFPKGILGRRQSKTLIMFEVPKVDLYKTEHICECMCVCKHSLSSNENDFLNMRLHREWWIKAQPWDSFLHQSEAPLPAFQLCIPPSFLSSTPPFSIHLLHPESLAKALQLLECIHESGNHRIDRWCASLEFQSAWPAAGTGPLFVWLMVV